MTFLVGLTGGIASGKSTVAKLFSNRHIQVIDADQIARDIVQPNAICYQQVVDLFGVDVIQGDGQLHRKAIRQQIFHDPVLKSKLEQILHPEITKQLFEQAKKVMGPYVILMVPLLFETGLERQMSTTITVDVDEQMQLSRLCKRDHIGREEAQNMLNQQFSRAQRLQLADNIIDNSQSIAFLESQVEILHQRYMQQAQKIAMKQT